MTCLQIVVVCYTVCVNGQINILLTTCPGTCGIPQGLFLNSHIFFMVLILALGFILIYYGKYINPGFFVVIKEKYLCIGGPMSVCARFSLEMKTLFLYRCCSRYLQFLSSFGTSLLVYRICNLRNLLIPCYLEGCVTALVSQSVYILYKNTQPVCGINCNSTPSSLDSNTFGWLLSYTSSDKEVFWEIGSLKFAVKIL